jgi:hypothetical protein
MKKLAPDVTILGMSSLFRMAPASTARLSQRQEFSEQMLARPQNILPFAANALFDRLGWEPGRTLSATDGWFCLGFQEQWDPADSLYAVETHFRQNAFGMSEKDRMCSHVWPRESSPPVWPPLQIACHRTASECRLMAAHATNFLCHAGLEHRIVSVQMSR